MLILQKKQSPTAQHQQIILCKSSFPHLELLFYATETHKLMQVKVEMRNIKEFLHMFSQKNAFKVFLRGLFLTMTFHPPFKPKLKGQILSCISAAVPLCQPQHQPHDNLDEREKAESRNANDTGRLETPVTWRVSLIARDCPLVLALHRAFVFYSEHY